ncbi:MAG: hypothetical protein QOF43_1314, partial [Gaiellaceae bacterium]|nr:hypothetical protein [Gaiellaceae bacterium]
LRATLHDRRVQIDAAVADAQRTASSLVAARSERIGFIANLRRRERLKLAQVQTLEATAQRVVHKADALQAAANTPEAAAIARPVQAPVSASTSAGGRLLTVSSTGYSLPGRTATGLPVGPGVVAVDPSVIPLGTRLTIPGYGEGVAADTGGAVRGNTIDLWFSTLADARAWGRRTVTITLH